MRTLLLLCCVSLMAACASSPVSKSYRPVLAQSVYEVDQERVAMVERQARSNWGQVIWVNLPTRRVEPDPGHY